MNTATDMPMPTASIRATFDRVRALAPPLVDTTADQRIAKIQRLMKTLMKYRQQIYETGKLERGLSPPDMDGELVMLKFEAEFIAKNLHDWMTPKPAEPSLMTLGKKCYVRYEPKGTVLVLPSWNAPYVIGFLPVLGAIAAGNSIILKPSELSPHSSALCARIVKEAFPDGEVSCIEGGAEAAQALLACPFNHIFYIGNNHVGRIVMKAAADHFASVTLEMGGKNPSIIDKSADVEDAALKTSWGRMCNAGQACIAPDYVLVHESVAQRFTEALVREIKAMYNPKGTGFENNPEFPRIINTRHFERIKGLIEDARAKGARFEIGGEYRAEDRYIAPTVVTQVNDDMRLMKEEIFGPMIAVVPYRTREEVVEYIAARDKPLALYVFSKDADATEYFIRHTTSGSSVVNHNVVQSGTNPHLPFGGVNSSGIGRMVGFATFNECSNGRAIVEEGPPLMDPREMFPPLTDKYKKQLSDLLDREKPIPGFVVPMVSAIIKLRTMFSRR
ncbi:aldehyde dehydrogenase (NAD+) [Hydrocarboniphaga daqingensis]|jgi:aldehyde dehydrogenase (NAD+)|uniref:Aldehyde dehydrogenase n=1 Tax=Hydrocarboniphaga daqingensis TaxID=490188 RepID=A0A1M5LUR3_9GAMM|nr:aldehyde dehydrogenase family protein [Hydrocarboniphaga daqingensis]SHG68798.1 aldehyde dehydrogenase (NAD+) [Hydrocarboniphaga daqingensis]